ncbi:MAG: MlaD family protein [Bacteroidota bacterium]
MKLSREIKTGIIVIGGVLLFILGFSFLKSSPLFDDSITLYAVYDEVGGLQPGTAVSINGLNVGTVNDIRFKDTSGRLLVTFSVNQDFRFSKNSEVELYDTGIIGGKGLQINPVFDGARMATRYDTLSTKSRPGLTELAQQKLTPLFKKFESAVTDADSVLMHVNDVLDDKARKDLRGAIHGLNGLVLSLQGSAEVLNRLLKDNAPKLDNSLTNFEELTRNFAQLSDSLNNAGLGSTLANLESMSSKLDQILNKLEQGEGTLGKLMEDEGLYTNLNNASRELDLLLQDFRLNPKRYVNVSVFGKKQKEYTVPQEDPAEQIQQ